MSKALHHLLIALPRDRASFLERFDDPNVGDAVRTWTSAGQGRAVTPAEVWVSYVRLAKRINEIADLSARLGVKVWTDATFSDLAAAMSVDVPLTLVAHWKDAAVSASDMRSPKTLLNTLGRSAAGDHALVRQLIGSAALSRIFDMPDSSASTEIATALQHIVEESDLDPTTLDDDPDEHRHARNREVLHRLFANDIVAGNRLELWDSMISGTAFGSTVPPGRKEAIDLAVCNSALVARSLQFTHDCPVIANRRPTSILLRLRLYEQTIIHVSRTGDPYVESLLKLRDHIDEQAEELK